MKFILFLLSISLLFSCQKTTQCHTVQDFYSTNPIDVKKVFAAGFKEVSCNLYAIDVTYYDRKQETIYMNYYHQVIQKQ